MILVIGTQSCSRCAMTKKILSSKGVEYEYKLLDELENKADYLEMAKEKGMLSMPLIIKDGELVDLKEVM